MQEFAEVSRGREQRRGGVAAPHRLTRHSQIIEDMTVWLFERGHCSHHHFHTPGALGALGSNAALAPEDPRSNRPLGGVVRGFHPFVRHKRPQGLRPLEQLPTDPFRLLDATVLSLFAQLFHLALDWPHRAGQARRGQRAVPDARPPVKPLARLEPLPPRAGMRLRWPSRHMCDRVRWSTLSNSDLLDFVKC
jgi:hypothetical protein